MPGRCQYFDLRRAYPQCFAACKRKVGRRRPYEVGQRTGEPGRGFHCLVDVAGPYAELRAEFGDYGRHTAGVVSVSVCAQHVPRLEAACLQSSGNARPFRAGVDDETLRAFLYAVRDDYIAIG